MMVPRFRITGGAEVKAQPAGLNYDQVVDSLNPHNYMLTADVDMF